MNILARFQAIEDKDKAAMVRKLLESSTPDFDFFYLTGLSVLMATLGLLLNSPSIVIGSMLIAPLMYPILAFALGMVMSNSDVIGRSTLTISKALAISLALAFVAGFFFGDTEMYTTAEVMSRTEPNYLYLLVAIIAGAAVSYALARPEWSATLPGIAISVALIPPLAAVGVGFAALDPVIIKGASVLLLLNFIGIITAAAASFMLMNLYQKQNIAESTIKREEQKMQDEQAAIEAAQHEQHKV